jgi:osmotically-inducible protein OsmY
MSRILLSATLCVFFVCGTLQAVGQQKDSDSLGDKVERGVRKAEAKLRETWGDIKKSTRRMTIEGRVYARLYWDKALADAPYKIESKEEGVIVLKGSVPNAEARHRAVELSQSTIGVTQTIDELAVEPNKEK